MPEDLKLHGQHMTSNLISLLCSHATCLNFTPVSCACKIAAARDWVHTPLKWDAIVKVVFLLLEVACRAFPAWCQDAYFCKTEPQPEAMLQTLLSESTSRNQQAPPVFLLWAIWIWSLCPAKHIQVGLIWQMFSWGSGLNIRSSGSIFSFIIFFIVLLASAASGKCCFEKASRSMDRLGKCCILRAPAKASVSNIFNSAWRRLWACYVGQILPVPINWRKIAASSMKSWKPSATASSFHRTHTNKKKYIYIDKCAGRDWGRGTNTLKWVSGIRSKRGIRPSRHLQCKALLLRVCLCVCAPKCQTRWLCANSSASALSVSAWETMTQKEMWMLFDLNVQGPDCSLASCNLEGQMRAHDMCS